MPKKKKPLTAYQKQKKELRKTKFAFYALFTCYILLAVSCFFLLKAMYFNQIALFTRDYSITGPEILYEGLTENEIKIASQIMSSVEPKYLIGQKKVIFTNDSTDTDYGEYCETCSGYNINDGELIVVEYRNDLTRLQYVVCHELLHSFVFGPEDIEEEIVADAALTLPCFPRERMEVTLQ